MPSKRLTRTPTTGALRYVGDGAYIHGVPARDLSPDEAARYADQIASAEAATHATLYEPVAEEPAEQPASPSEANNG